MTTKGTAKVNPVTQRRDETLKKYQEAAATRAEYLRRRQKKQVLETSHRIAIFGAQVDLNSPSFIRTEKLLGYGLEIVPVIPGCEQYLGLPCCGSLGEAPDDVDIVQVYPAEDVELLEIAKEAVKKGGVRAFWIEEGEATPEVKDVLAEGRIQVVEHESLEREYGKHFPFFGTESVLSVSRRATVAERMTHRPVTVKSGESINDAMEKMKHGRFRHLPVVDGEGRLTGMLSDRDIRLIRAPMAFFSKERVMTRLLASTVEQAAVFDPVKIDPEASLEEAAKLMLRWEIGGLPVVSKDRWLLGILTYTDLLREFIARGN